MTSLTIDLQQLKSRNFQLITAKELCSIYPFKEQTLAVDRMNNKGIPFIKLPTSRGRVFYIKEIVDMWLLDHLYSCDACIHPSVNHAELIIDIKNNN
jgi:hypothetical protein